MTAPQPRKSALMSDLVARAQRGDHEAFDALAGAAYQRLYAIARRMPHPRQGTGASAANLGH